MSDELKTKNETIIIRPGQHFVHLDVLAARRKDKASVALALNGKSEHHSYVYADGDCVKYVKNRKR